MNFKENHYLFVYVLTQELGCSVVFFEYVSSSAVSSNCARFTCEK